MEPNTNTSENKMNPMIIVGIIIAILVIGAVVILGMGGNNSQTPSNETSMESENMIAEDNNPSNDNDDMMMETDQSVIEVEGGAFYFEPNEIRVKAGEPVTITLNSVTEDDDMEMMHDFVIDELNVQSEEAAEGESTTFTFTPTEPGEYEFYCSVGEHRANGMFGTLIVE